TCSPSARSRAAGGAGRRRARRGKGRISMQTKYDLLIRNSQLRGRPDERYDIAIADGKIAMVEKEVKGEGSFLL
ncbi:MAG: hypothetical protein R6U51_05735, partial [Anaerolineales bacterium]